MGNSNSGNEEVIVSADLLECPICTEVPLPPIHNCVNGHIICSDCLEKVQKCGICEGEFSTVRNRAVESIIGSSLLPCRYEPDGCKAILKGDLLPQHMKECKFQPVVCFWCKNIVSFANFVSHLKSAHSDGQGYDSAESNYIFYNYTNIEGFQRNSAVLSAPIATDTSYEWSWCPNPKYFLYDGKYFISNIKIDRIKGTWGNWVTLIGTEEEASKYAVTITFYKEKLPVPQINWDLPVVSFRRPVDKIEATASLLWNNIRPLLTTDYTHSNDKTYKFMWTTKYVLRKL